MPALLDPGQVARDVEIALAEDIGTGDLTAGLLAPGAHLTTRVVSREAAVLAGRPWFDETYRQLGGVAVAWRCEEGMAIAVGQEVCRVEGDAASILSGERTALNFIQTLSGTATQTRRFVEAVAGTGVPILDTRKTLPGLRLAQKYAVSCGGGCNHRLGLFDAILIKENHINAAGSLAVAVQTAFELHPGVLVEVEVENMVQLEEALASGAQRALLDNFSLDQLRDAAQAYGGRIQLEASGNVTLDSVRAIAETGVDYISSGAITKNLQAVDFSMRFV